MRKNVLIVAGLTGFALAAPAGAAVLVGSSSLIGTLDYSDTFTGTDAGGHANRPFVAAVQGAPAYVIENSYANPSVNLRSQSQPAGVAEFSFASDSAGLVNGSPTYPGTSGAGSATGITQTGGSVDYGIPYGVRSVYVVQVDAVASSDRVDITSGPTAGTIFDTGGSLSVFIRGDGSGNVGIFNGATDTAVQSQPGYGSFTTGLANDGAWHNYAVKFDTTNKSIEIFIDQSSKGVIDLTTFAGGLYANFSNAAVGVGEGVGGGQNRSWTDNFQVGAAVPEPTSLGLVGLGSLLLVRRGRWAR